MANLGSIFPGSGGPGSYFGSSPMMPGYSNSSLFGGGNNQQAMPISQGLWGSITPSGTGVGFFGSSPMLPATPQAPVQNWQNAANPTQAYQNYENDYANYVNQYAAYQNSLAAAPGISQLLQSMGTQPQPSSQPMQPAAQTMNSIAQMVAPYPYPQGGAPQGPLTPSAYRGQTWAPGAGASFTPPERTPAPWTGPIFGHPEFAEAYGLGGGGGGLQRAIAGAKYSDIPAPGHSY